MDEFIRELEEDLQRDKARQAFARYGKWVIGAAVIAVVGTAAGVAWNYHQKAEYAEQTAALQRALDEAEKKTEGSEKQLEQLAHSGSTPHAAIAGLHYAARLAELGQKDAAAAEYTRISAINSLDTGLRDLARTHALSLSAQNDAKAISTASPFQLTQRELLGWQALAAGKPEEARTQFETVRNATGAPPSIEERANLVASSLASTEPSKEVRP